MADKKRLNLSFAMYSPVQREAWERLSAVPARRRTDAVCRAVCRMYEEDSLLKSIRQIVREELSRVNFIAGPKNIEQPQAGDVDDDVLGFLRSLQEGEDND